VTLGAEAYALRQAVAARVEGTAYEMVETTDGFDLNVRVADASWYGPLGKAGRRKIVQHHVVLDEAGRSFSLEDRHYDLEWSVGVDVSTPVPRLVASSEQQWQRGRVVEISRVKVVGLDPSTGEVTTPIDYLFRSQDGQSMIREPAEALGWQERAGSAQRVGVVVGIIGGLGALAALVVAGITLLR
jgi:hypothetical protein